MACAERGSLWGYLSGELDKDAKADLEAHLAFCEECQSELEAIKATREVLSMASTVEPKVDWRKADRQVLDEAERRLVRPARWRLAPSWALGFGVAACAVAVLALLRQPEPASRTDAPVASIEPAPATALHEAAIIEATEGARVEAEKGSARLAAQGEAVAQGTVLTTPEAGRALVRLPEKSRLRLGSGGVLRLAKATPNAVALELKSGRVAIRASHAQREEFRVEVLGVKVFVVGTAFSVTAGEREVGIAVAEGKVAVDVPGAERRYLTAGERLLVEREAWQARGGRLGEADRIEFEELGVAVPAVRAEAPVAEAPQAPSLAAAPAVAVPAAPAAPAAVAQAPRAPEPTASAPAFTPIVVSPTPLAPEAGPVPAPTPAAPAWRPPPELTSKPAEDSLLSMAEASLKTGKCGRYLAMLENYLEEPETVPSLKEKARYLRARCFEENLMSVEADAEWRKYLREYPEGRWAAEARKVVAN